MNQCKDCRFYKMTNDGPYCHRKPRPVPVSPITSKDCFEAPEPPAADPVQTKAVEAPQEKPKRRGGRPNMHPNYVEGGVTMKWCRMCKEYRPIGEFYAKSGTPDGHAYECRACRTEHQRKKREEKRQNAQASKRVRQSLEKKLAPLANAIKKRFPLDQYVENVLFKIPMDLFSGKVEISFRPGKDSVDVEIRRSDEK